MKRSPGIAAIGSSRWSWTSASSPRLDRHPVDEDDLRHDLRRPVVDEDPRAVAERRLARRQMAQARVDEVAGDEGAGVGEEIAAREVGALDAGEVDRAAHAGAHLVDGDFP